MITYNHGAYIEDAIKGILAQEVDANLKLIIGDDCSTDGTIVLLDKYEKEFPDFIKVIRRESNVGMMQNFVDVLRLCTGDYIAICEGDDCWTDPTKLKEQLVLLETNKRATICFTDLFVQYPNITEKLHAYYEQSPDSLVTIKNLLNGNCIVTCTTMFNNILTEEMLFQLSKFKVGDWPLYLLILKKSGGEAIFLNQKTSIYRKHENGSYSKLKLLSKLKIDLSVYEVLLEMKAFKNERRFIKSKISKTCYGIALREVDGSRAEYLFKSIKKIDFGNIWYPCKSVVSFIFKTKIEQSA